ncbi:MAG TPA: cadherin-like domain-containing protein, partial [Anaerolineae bacterium]|nr:cadherin-like domain-containing protein [Anaerolineae bacterium]
MTQITLHKKHHITLIALFFTLFFTQLPALAAPNHLPQELPTPMAGLTTPVASPSTTVDDDYTTAQAIPLAITHPISGLLHNDTPNTVGRYHAQLATLPTTGTLTLQNWGQSTAVAPAQHDNHNAPLTTINGYPALAYAHNNTLFYQTALDTYGQTWSPPVTVTANTSINHITLASVNNMPVIIYKNSATLYYISAQTITGSNWNTPVTINIPSDAFGFNLTTVAAIPAISYQTNSTLYYQSATDINGSSWLTPTIITTNTNLQPHALITIDNRPALTYYHADTQTIRYQQALTSNGDSWDTPVTIASGLLGNSLAVMTLINNQPAIAYSTIQPDTSHHIYFSHRTNTNSWSSPQFLTTTGYHLTPISLQLQEIKGKPYLAFSQLYDKYTSEITTQLIYATTNDYSTWHQETAVPSTSYLLGLLNNNNEPFIAYWANQTIHTTHHNWDGTFTYTPAPNFNGPITFTYTIQDNPWATPLTATATIHISPDNAPQAQPDHYYLQTNTPMTLSLPTAAPLGNDHDENPTQLTANLVTSVNTGTLTTNQTATLITSLPTSLQTNLQADGGFIWPTIQSVQGHPAIVATTSTGIIYSRALDPQGTNWSTPSLISSATGFVAFDIVDGHPTIVFNDGNTLHYSRALDNTGTNWPLTPATITPITDFGFGFAVINDRPAVSYSHMSNIYFAHATDATGTSWTTQLAATTNFGGDRLSLTLINDLPAIAYFDFYQNTIVYTSATNATGSAWSSPVNVVNTNGFIGPFSLANINDHPAIAYDIANPDYQPGIIVQYVRALDSAGQHWPVPQTIASDSLMPRLTTHDGLPAIAYTHTDGDDLQPRYQLGRDAAGTHWGPANRLGQAQSTWAQDLLPSNLLTDDQGQLWYAYQTSDELRFGSAEAWDGTFTYTPPLNYTGPVNFTYQAQDEYHKRAATTTVTLTITSTLPTITPTAHISLTNNTPTLHWTTHDTACTYNIHHNTTPYFTPTPATYLTTGLHNTTAQAPLPTTSPTFFYLQALDCVQNSTL